MKQENEADLLFERIRDQSPQWNIRHGEGGPIVARVTQRHVAEPPYAVTFVVDDEDKGDALCDDRSGVIKTIQDDLEARNG